MRRHRGIDPRLSGAVVVGLLVLAVVMAAGAVASVRSSTPDVSDVAPIREVEPPEMKSLLVIGDSWTDGGVMNDGPTWPFLMDLPKGWTVTGEGIDGTGYIGDHADSALTYEDRLRNDLREHNPDVVLVAMGRNDVQHDPIQVGEVAREDLSAMKRAWPSAAVVVFSPFSPEPPTETTVALTAELEDVATSLGLPFVDVSRIIGDRPQLIEAFHPNDAGHAVLAEAIYAELSDLGLFD